MIDDPATVLAREYAALNEATRRAHEAIADMRAERQLLNKELAAARTELADGVKGLLEAEVQKGLQQFHEATRKAMSDAVTHVDEQLQKYLDVALGTDPTNKAMGRMGIPALIREARDRERAREEASS